jgi:hypothetical protein
MLALLVSLHTLAGFVAHGQPVRVGSEFRVNTYTIFDQERPAATVGVDGGFVVVWQDTRSRDGDRTGIFGQRFDSAGSLVGADFQVNSSTIFHQNYTDIASRDDGDFVVVWRNMNSATEGIFGRMFDSAGLALADEFRISLPVGKQGPPQLAIDDAGRRRGLGELPLRRIKRRVLLTRNLRPTFRCRGRGPRRGAPDQ